MQKRDLVELVCLSLDKTEKKIFKQAELKAQIGGNLGAGRIFMLDDKIWRIDKVVKTKLIEPATNGNYRHSRQEYRMRNWSKI